MGYLILVILLNKKFKVKILLIMDSESSSFALENQLINKESGKGILNKEDYFKRKLNDIKDSIENLDFEKCIKHIEEGFSFHDIEAYFSSCELSEVIYFRRG